MNYKRTVRGIVCGIIMFGIVYFCGAFYETSWVLHKWQEQTRLIVSLVGGILSVVAGLICGNWENTTLK